LQLRCIELTIFFVTYRWKDAYLYIKIIFSDNWNESQIQFFVASGSDNFIFVLLALVVSSESTIHDIKQGLKRIISKQEEGAIEPRKISWCVLTEPNLPRIFV
jgi:hypothetical protein